MRSCENTLHWLSSHFFLPLSLMQSCKSSKKAKQKKKAQTKAINKEINKTLGTKKQLLHLCISEDFIQLLIPQLLGALLGMTRYEALEINDKQKKADPCPYGTYSLIRELENNQIIISINCILN